MLNQIILVGKLQQIVDYGDKAKITIASKSIFKDTNGEYKTDYVDFLISNGIKEQIIDYCKQGDIIGIHGRIQTQNEKTEKETILIAEKISFLSTNPNLKKEDE